MNKDNFNWLSGLDQTGWIAAALFAVFFIVAALTIAMMLKLNAENKKNKRNKTPEKPAEKPAVKPQPAAKQPAKPRPKPVKAETRIPEKKDDDTSPLEQAEVYITYGLNKQAVDLLKDHLEKSPADKAAIELLARAQAGMEK
jgi:outer membrane biosynthesis protein TonB